MQTITHNQFASLLAAAPGTVILSIVADTDPKLRKTGNPFKTVRKLTYTRVVSGASYKAAVERQGGEGFEAAPLPYGEEVVKNKVILGPKGDFQLRTVARNPRKPISVTYIADGEEVTFDKIASFLPPRYENKRQAIVGVTGKKQVMVRNFSFNNIKEVRMFGKVYKLVA
jgi:hypothetical protein